MMEIQKWVRQGCVLSPILVNLYSEELFKEAFEYIGERIQINGVLINNLRYADGTVLITNSNLGVQAHFDRIFSK